MPPNEAGERALAAIDAVRAERPHKDGHKLSEALRCLAQYRHALTRQNGDAAGRARLQHLNAVISSVLGIQFPVGEVPWAELDHARGWLAALLAQEE